MQCSGLLKIREKVNIEPANIELKSGLTPNVIKVFLENKISYVNQFFDTTKPHDQPWKLKLCKMQ